MKQLIITLLCFFGLINAQQSHKLGSFASVEANAGIDAGYLLAQIIGNEENTLSHFSYSISAQAGYQPFNRWAFATGPRYTYLSPNYHALYWASQCYFFLQQPEDGEFPFISVYYGKQINRSVVSNGTLVGISAGKKEIVHRNLGHKFQGFLDFHFVGDRTVPVFGISYGITLFSNRRL